MKIIFSGGGTGGHIYPGIALIKALREHDSNVDILYIGKIGAQEEKLCEKENIQFIGIKVRYFYRKLIYKNILTIYEFIKAYRRVKKIIKEVQPDMIIGTGGYVSSPVVYAAHKMKVKTIIHEQNSVPGLTNKILGKYADQIAITYPSSEAFFPKEKVVLTGNPRAQEVVKTPYVPKSKFGLNENKKLVLFFTGSLGAKYVNEAIVQILPDLSKRKDIEIIFVTGESHYNNINSETAKLNMNKNVFIKPYVYNMPELLRMTDLVICRAGATSLAEITAIGIPSILIPSPYVTNNHQEKNAQFLVENKASLMVPEHECGEKLGKVIKQVLDDPILLQTLRINSKKIGIQDASDKFIDLIKTLI